jgi:3-phosphoshikimate 1-carboxyvinyltransferase
MTTILTTMTAAPNPSTNATCRGLAPGGVMGGSFRPAGSKSLAQRVLVTAGLAGGETRLTNAPAADDVRAALALLAGCGVPISNKKGALAVEGRPPSSAGWNPRSALSTGESATLARFASAVLALARPKDQHAVLVPEGTLRRRQSVALFRALAGSGVGCEFDGIEGGFAVRLRSAQPPADVFLEEPSSSQEVSALLIALASHEGRYHLHVRGDIPSLPYTEMTAKVLEMYGARIQLWNNSEGVLISIEGPLTAPEGILVIEPDASTAGVALAAACLSGGALEIQGLGTSSVQGDIRIVEHLTAFGCEASAEEDRLWAKGRPTQGAEVDLSREPDLAPVVVAVAAAAAIAGGESRLRGLQTLPGKESDRIRVLARGLRAIGLTADAGADFLEVTPGRAADEDVSTPILLDPAGDHRMAFAFALLGLLRADVFVLGSECVAKSWPAFWRDLEVLGATVVAR